MLPFGPCCSPGFRKYYCCYGCEIYRDLVPICGPSRFSNPSRRLGSGLCTAMFLLLNSNSRQFPGVHTDHSSAVVVDKMTSTQRPSQPKRDLFPSVPVDLYSHMYHDPNIASWCRLSGYQPFVTHTHHAPQSNVILDQARHEDNALDGRSYPPEGGFKSADSDPPNYFLLRLHLHQSTFRLVR